MKHHLIPLIDDFGGATSDNPGILGIKVTPWHTPQELKNNGYRYREDEQIVTLADVVAIVRQHYQALHDKI